MSKPRQAAEKCPLCDKLDTFTESGLIGTCADHGWFVRGAWDKEPAPHPAIVQNHAILLAVMIEYTNGIHTFACNFEASPEQRAELIQQYSTANLAMTPDSIKSALLEAYRAGVNHAFVAKGRS